MEQRWSDVSKQTSLTNSQVQTEQRGLGMDVIGSRTLELCRSFPVGWSYGTSRHVKRTRPPEPNITRAGETEELELLSQGSTSTEKSLVSCNRGNRLSGWRIDLFFALPQLIFKSPTSYGCLFSSSSFLFFLPSFFSFKMKLELGRW